MKRVLAVICIVFIFLLSSCGNSEDYSFDYVTFALDSDLSESDIEDAINDYYSDKIISYDPEDRMLKGVFEQTISIVDEYKLNSTGEKLTESKMFYSSNIKEFKSNYVVNDNIQEEIKNFELIEKLKTIYKDDLAFEGVVKANGSYDNKKDCIYMLLWVYDKKGNADMIEVYFKLNKVN